MRVVALDHQRCGLQARLVAGRLFNQLDGELPALTPAGVHARQHPRPIAALGAAGPRMHFDVSVELVRLARQKGFNLAALGFHNQRLEHRDALLLSLGIVFGFAKLDERDRVLQLTLEARE